MINHEAKKLIVTLGKKNGGEETWAAYMKRVERSCASNGATKAVLMAIIGNTPYKENTSRMFRPEIIAISGYGKCSVNNAIQHLQNARILHILEGGGGRERATKWVITPAGGGERVPPDLSQAWGNQHPYWQSLKYEIKSRSPSKWLDHFASLRFLSIDDGVLYLLAKTAYHARKIETKQGAFLIECANAGGLDVKDVHITYP